MAGGRRHDPLRDARIIASRRASNHKFEPDRLAPAVQDQTNFTADGTLAGIFGRFSAKVRGLTERRFIAAVDGGAIFVFNF